MYVFPILAAVLASVAVSLYGAFALFRPVATIVNVGGIIAMPPEMIVFSEGILFAQVGTRLTAKFLARLIWLIQDVALLAMPLGACAERMRALCTAKPTTLVTVAIGFSAILADMLRGWRPANFRRAFMTTVFVFRIARLECFTAACAHLGLKRALGVSGARLTTILLCVAGGCERGLTLLTNQFVQVRLALSHFLPPKTDGREKSGAVCSDIRRSGATLAPRIFYHKTRAASRRIT